MPICSYNCDSWASAAEWPLPAELARKRGERAAAWRARLGEDGWAAVEAWRAEHIMHPHQLRHNAATRIAERFDRETARAVLGHATLRTTMIYDEAAARDIRTPADAMSQMG